MKKHSWGDPHIIRTIKSLLRAFYVAIGVFLFLFVLFHITGALYVSSIASKASKTFHTGIASDLAYLKKQGDELAVNDTLQRYILDRDSDSLIRLTKQEIINRDIGLMGVMDSNGILLSRTKSVGNLGNNIFLTNPVGRIVAQGKSAESVEATVGFDPRQIFLNTGRPVMRDGQMIGALTANYLADDTYAKRFKDRYLSDGIEIVFYNKNAGVYGNSFSDTETHKLISSYFNVGSDWIQNGLSDKTVSFKDGSFYLVKNIIFPGLEQSPGGALIFIPRHDLSKTMNIVTVLITLLVFIIYAYRFHKNTRGEERGWRYYLLYILVAIPMCGLTFFGLSSQKIGFLKLERIPYVLYNSTMRLQPEFGIYDLGFEQRISIFVDTGDEAINAVQVGLIFDPQLVEVRAVETENSVCAYVSENIINNKEGLIKFSCAILKSGGEVGSLNLADVLIMPKKSGTFTLSFDSEITKVLASDGLLTDVLRVAQSGSYRVDEFDSTLHANEPQKRSFVVFSPTHPNQSRYYNSPKAHFVWKGKPDSVYIYALDSFPDTVPSGKNTTQGTSIELPIPGDGIFYFHLRLASGGPVAHYKLQSDSTPPLIASIKTNTDKVFAGDIVRLSFDAEDLISGIQRNYYVNLSNHLFLPIGSQLFIPFMNAGDHQVVLRVYDGAGNYTDKSQIIHVDAKD